MSSKVQECQLLCISQHVSQVLGIKMNQRLIWMSMGCFNLKVLLSSSRLCYKTSKWLSRRCEQKHPCHYSGPAGFGAAWHYTTPPHMKDTNLAASQNDSQGNLFDPQNERSPNQWVGASILGPCWSLGCNLSFRPVCTRTWPLPPSQAYPESPQSVSPPSDLVACQVQLQTWPCHGSKLKALRSTLIVFCVEPSQLWASNFGNTRCWTMCQWED